jgi:hypothetical protein
MAREALRKDLRGEVAFLACYDQVVRSVNERYDVSGPTLTTLILMVHQNGGVLSKNRRKQFLGEVEDAALNFIESSVKRPVRPRTHRRAFLRTKGYSDGAIIGGDT